MKNYVKPTVEIYTLSGNETICGGCDIKIKDNASLGATLDFLGGNDDGGNILNILILHFYIYKY